jgi:hypothetical protein
MKCMRTFIFSLLTFVFFASSCKKDSVKEQYSFFRPVYHTKAEVRADIRNSAARDILTTGKLVWKDHYIFLNDVDRGVHIIDITDPYKPKQVSFIAIPGSAELAVNDNFLYADCYTDLVTVDISDPLNVKLKEVIPGVFQSRAYIGFRPDTSKVITEWMRVDTVIRNDFDASLKSDLGFLFSASSGFVATPGAAAIGLAGSTARFALQNQRLYTVSNSDLKVFNTTNAAVPAFVKTVAMGAGGIETVFPYQDKLFIGSTTGMFVYSTQNPDLPQRLSKFEHARSCDPVIADDTYAYVTLRGSGRCGGAANQLDVINISDILSPKLIMSYPLQSPSGLSKDGNLLFICDGKDGLKVFDATNVTQITQLKQLGGFTAYDVIAQHGVAITVATEGLHMFDYTNPANIKEAGKILTMSK